MAKKKRRKKRIGLLGTMMSAPLFPYAFVLSCAKDYKPMNSKGRKISRANKKKWF